MSKTISERVSTGVAGLDEVLQSGLIAGRSYLVRGDPGTGKTALGFHFLSDGVASGESTLFINLEEGEADVRANAASMGFDLSDVNFLDLSPSSAFFAEDQSYSVFASGDVSEESPSDAIKERVEALDPDRVFLDPVTQFRYLTNDDYQFRKQVISFMRYLKEADATVLFTSQRSASTPDDDLQFLSDGIVDMQRSSEGRSIAVPKFRGSDRQAGRHALEITDEGLVVYPKIVPGDHAADVQSEQIPSGVAGLDELLGGGIERGTITVISGPTGVGKTTTATLFSTQAATNGERAVFYHFEEAAATFRERCSAIGIPVPEQERAGRLHVEEVEPLAHSPESFAAMVREQVEEQDASVVVIDGIKGYTLSVRGEEAELVRKLHSLGRYLKNMGVTVVLVDEVDSVTGDFQATNTGISYLADNVLFMRHVEIEGALRKVVGVLKKRIGTFESTLREFEITGDGVQIGDPLTGFRGLIRGTPEIRDSSSEDD